MTKDFDLEKLLKEKTAIKLELGGGNNPNPGFVNIDILPLERVDIVWDLERTPWPLPDACAFQVVASHVLEHITPHGGDKRLQGLVELLVDKNVIGLPEAERYMGNPGSAFINVMNEIWRVLRPQGQLAFVVPYAESQGMFQDPTHINFINETTMTYFDPLDPGMLYQFYKPKPWKVERQYVQKNGLLEVLMSKRADSDEYDGQRKPMDIIDDVVMKKPDIKEVRHN